MVARFVGWCLGSRVYLWVNLILCVGLGLVLGLGLGVVLGLGLGLLFSGVCVCV